MIHENPTSRPSLASAFAFVVVAASLALSSGAMAEDSDQPQVAQAKPEVRVIGPDGQPVQQPEPTSDVQRYCSNISDPALDARNALQMARIKDAETQLSAKIDELESKRVEVEKWLAERKAFMDSTSSIALDIYASMKPDAAAEQIVGLDKATAAALLARLKPRQAGAIMGEMPPKVAAELGGMIAEKTDRSALAGTAEADKRS